MRIRTEPVWTTARGILPSCDTWHSTSCRRMAQRRRCAASFSEPGGTTPISLASSPCSEVRLPCIAQADAALAAYTAAANAQALDPVRDSDLLRILPLLDQAQALPYGANAEPIGGQWFPGLSQTDKLEAASKITYRHALENILLPRLMVRLESQMRQNFNQPAF